MIVARANQVLNEISKIIDTIDSEVERLALLLAEAHREKYWQMRYKTEDEWIRVCIGTSSSRYYCLVAVGEAFEGCTELITKLGIEKCMILRRFVKNGCLPEHWKQWAESMNVKSLAQHARKFPGLRQITTEVGAMRRIEVLKQSLEILKRKELIILREISALRKKWGISEAA